MNTIIVGCGKVGQKLAEQLSQEDDQDITVIDLRNGVVQVKHRNTARGGYKERRSPNRGNRLR